MRPQDRGFYWVKPFFRDQWLPAELKENAEGEAVVEVAGIHYTLLRDEVTVGEMMVPPDERHD